MPVCVCFLQRPVSIASRPFTGSTALLGVDDALDFYPIQGAGGMIGASLTDAVALEIFGGWVIASGASVWNQFGLPWTFVGIGSRRLTRTPMDPMSPRVMARTFIGEPLQTTRRSLHRC